MKKTTILSSLLFLTFSLVAGNAYEKGWEAFLKNERNDARKYFVEAANDPNTKADALLSLCLLNTQEIKEDAAFQNIAEFHETSPNSQACIYALHSQNFAIKSRNSNKIALVEKMLNNNNFNGTIKAVLNSTLGDYYHFAKNTKKSGYHYAQLGTIDKWQALGAFDNISGSGFSKDWAAVEKAKTSDVFKNNVNANVKWYTPPFNDEDKWFRFNYYFSLNNIIVYAQSFVKSPVEQEAYIRIGTSGSLKVWVNDALAGVVPEERNCDLDIYSYKVKLNAGANRILIQIGQSEINRANFMLRITDENANPIGNITSSEQYENYKKSNEQYNTESLPFFVEEFFRKKIEEDAENPINYLLLAETYLRNDKGYEATKILKILDNKYPDATIISSRLAEAYLRSRNLVDYNKEIEKIKQTDPNAFFSLKEAFEEAVNSERYDEAQQIGEKAKQLYGANFVTEAWDIQLAAYQRRIQDLVSLSTILYKKYPESFDWTYLYYNMQTNLLKNADAAVSIIEKYCKKYNNDNAMETLSKIYFQQGKNEKGLGIIKQQVAASPYATGYWNNLAGTLYQLQRYPEALAAVEKFIELAPYIGSIYNTKGYIFKGMGNNANAKENFEKAIYYQPTSYDSRAQLRQLDNKKELNDFFPKNDIEEIIKNAPTAKEYPQSKSVILLNDKRLIVYPEGAQETQYELAVKILNQAGIADWKEYNISYNDNYQRLIVDKAELIKANGKKTKAESYDDTFVFTNLEVNDILYITYRIQNYSVGKLAQEFFSNFRFQHWAPSIINRYSILVPKDRKFDYKVMNGVIEPTIGDVEDMKLYTWELRNQAEIKDEPRMSATIDIIPTLFYSSMVDWQFVGDWYRDITASKFESDYVLKETVASLMAGKEHLSDLEKARIFYNYIVETITYSNVPFLQSSYIPQKASRTISTRLGDCKDVSTLFVTLCREVGIKANLVLVSTRNYGSNTMILPATDFNHCIALLSADGKEYYLDMTDNTLSFGALPLFDINAEILVIPFKDEKMNTTISRLNSLSRQKNAIERTHLVSINNNDLNIQRRSVYWGSQASSRRNSYRYIGDEERTKKMSEAVVSGFTAAVKVSNLTFENLDNLEDSLIINCRIDVQSGIQEIAGMKIVKLPWTDTFGSTEFVNAETREYPMVFWSAFDSDYCSENIVFTLPRGKTFAEKPQNIHLECEAAAYTLKFTEKATGQIIATRTLVRKTDQVPVNEYENFRKFILGVHEYDNKQYGIK